MSDEERRYWILDPVGHRRLWAEQLPEDGSVVDSFMGPAVMIVPPQPADDEPWICDVCNEIILTVWGGEPFPVPSDGSYALCFHHYETYRSGHLWPSNLCACDACIDQAKRWHPQLWKAYRNLYSGVIAQN